MPCVVDSRNSDEPIITQIETTNAAIHTVDPYRLQFGSVERAHDVERKYADGSCVREDRNAPATMFRDCLIQFPCCAIESLAVAFAT